MLFGKTLCCWHMKYILKNIKGLLSYLLQVKSRFGEAMLLYIEPRHVPLYWNLSCF